MLHRTGYQRICEACDGSGIDPASRRAVAREQALRARASLPWGWIPGHHDRRWPAGPPPAWEQSYRDFEQQTGRFA